MPDFSAQLRVGQVSDGLYQAFNQMLSSTQTAMAAIAAENSQLEEKCSELSKENSDLRARNEKLNSEVSRLTAMLGSHGSGVRERETTGEELAFVMQRSIKIHDAPVHSVTMRASSSTVATGSWDGTAKLYNLATEEVVRTLGTEGGAEDGSKMGGLYAVAFAKTAPDILGCASADKSVYLWNHATGKLHSKLQGHQDEVNGIDFHSTQQVMCTASDDCKVIIWDFQEGIVLRTLEKHTKAVYGATFLGEANQYLVATCCFDQKIRVFDMRDRQAIALLQTHTDDVIGIDYSADKDLLATGSDDGHIGIWDTRIFKLQQKINTKEDPGIPDNEVKRVTFSPNGSLLAAACSSGRVLVYDITTKPARRVAQLGGHTDCVFDVAWGQCSRSDAKILVSASHDRTCRYWREEAI